MISAGDRGQQHPWKRTDGRRKKKWLEDDSAAIMDASPPAPSLFMNVFLMYACLSREIVWVGWGFKVAPHCYHRNMALWSLLAPFFFFFCSWICSASGPLLSHHPLRSLSAASKISLFEDLSRLQVKRRAISGSIKTWGWGFVQGCVWHLHVGKTGGKVQQKTWRNGCVHTTNGECMITKVIRVPEAYVHMLTTCVQVPTRTFRKDL